MPERNIPSIIESLKRIREERELSVAEVARRVEEDAKKTGNHLAESTVYRVFREGSEKESFDYERTLKPIVRVLSDMTVDDEFDPDRARIYYEQRNALQDVVRYRNDEIAEHRRHMQKVDTEHADQLQQQKEAYIAKIEEIKAMYGERCAAHAAHIASLEEGVKYYRSMLDSFLASQKEERESRKLLFAEIQRLMDDVKRLKKLHNEEE